MKTVVPWQDSVFFKNSPPRSIAEIQKFIKESTYPAGAMIFSEGDPAEDLYVLKSGQVELSYSLPTRQDSSVRITLVEPGEVFAWSALTGSKTLTASALALEESESWLIPAARLQEVMDKDPKFGYQVMGRLANLIARRLKDTRVQLQWLHSL